ncbi:MAG: hypothetical protein KY462_08855 [Actinobacteria bacterium]|nr:hypothetical protein [Actinomycetota bacterium]
MLETLFSALSAKVVAGAVSAVTAAGLVAGATGQLPDAVQDGLNEAAARIGISVPAGSQDEPVTTTTEELKPDTVGTEELDSKEPVRDQQVSGERVREEGERSSTAEAVRSVIDEHHGEPGEFGKSQSQSDDPSEFGRAVSDTASDGRASAGRDAGTRGTTVADDKGRQERPAAANQASDARPQDPPADVPANEASDAHRPQNPPADVPANEASDAHRPDNPRADAGQGKRPDSVEPPARP